MRQILAGLFRGQVRGIPVGPVLVVLTAGALLVLAVGGSRTTQRTRQIACRAERGRGRVNTPGESVRDLLKQPAIAVRIVERGERAVAALLRVRAADASPSKQVRLVRACENAR